MMCCKAGTPTMRTMSLQMPHGLAVQHLCRDLQQPSHMERRLLDLSRVVTGSAVPDGCQPQPAGSHWRLADQVGSVGWGRRRVPRHHVVAPEHETLAAAKLQ